MNTIVLHSKASAMKVEEQVLAKQWHLPYFEVSQPRRP